MSSDFKLRPCLALFCLAVCLRACLVSSQVYPDDMPPAANFLEDSPDLAAKRLSNFVRIGRVNSFVRIGRPSSFVRSRKDVQGDNGDGLEESREIRDTERKKSSFVRIGRYIPLHRFIRIGRADAEGDAGMAGGDPMTEVPMDATKRSSSFVRIGRAVAEGDAGMAGDDPMTEVPMDATKRSSSFVRIGRMPSNFVRIGRMPSNFVRIGRMPSNFVRIGRGPSSFVRIGKSPFGYNDELKGASKRVPSNFVRIGKSLDTDVVDYPEEEKRTSSFVRIGKSPSSFVRIGKSPSNFVRIGKSPSNFVRIGKSPSSFVRIGKSDGDDSEDNYEKRSSSFVRIGKSAGDFEGDSETMDTDKRGPSSFVRIGKSDLNEHSLSNQMSAILGEGGSEEEVKRASQFVRIGKGAEENSKRMSNFVRIGKSLMNAADDIAGFEPSKKTSSFVRIGKDASGSSSMSSSSVSSSPSQHIPPSPPGEREIDGNSVTKDAPINVANRSSAFVRIGKIPSSAFVRIGKQSNRAVMGGSQRRGSNKGRSSFIRIGK